MKVAICIPCHGDPRAEFTLSLSRMLLATAAFRGFPNLGIEIFLEGHSNLPLLRSQLVEKADKWGADWLLFLDSDHVFPPSTLIRLLARQLPVVAANYVRRAEPAFPTATPLNDETGFVWTTAAKAKAQEVEEISHCGLGVFLADMQYVRKAKRPLFAFKAEGRLGGEDTWFCRRLRKAGAKIYIDHALSWEVGHVFSKPLYHRDAVFQPGEGKIGAPKVTILR